MTAKNSAKYKRKNLKPMLKPKSVAIIGASRDPSKVGHVILQNYINSGYEGKIYPVNKSGEDILDIKTYKNIGDIKKKVDLAIIAIPAQFVPQVLEECGKAGARTAVVVSGGFAEIGNVDLQKQMADVAEKYGMPTLGPNCLGVMDSRSRSDTLFLPTYKLSKPQIGGVSFVAQSGAVGSTILDLIVGEGFGMSKFFSYGNAAHVDEVDILDYLMHDKETRVIVMYVEGINRGKEFLRIAKEAGKKKPIVILKAGLTAAGQQAAHSHTAALAGNYQTHEAVFRQAGFTIAHDIKDLLYYAKIFASEPEPNGPRVAILTNGGGAGVLTTDAIASTRDLRLAEFGKETTAALKKTMPALVNIRNPLDLAGDADDKRYGDALAALQADQNIDMLIVITLFQTPGADSRVASKLIEYKDKSAKPMINISIGSSYTMMHKIMMESAGLPVYDSPAAAAAALSELLRFYKFKSRK